MKLIGFYPSPGMKTVKVEGEASWDEGGDLQEWKETGENGYGIDRTEIIMYMCKNDITKPTIMYKEYMPTKTFKKE